MRLVLLASTALMPLAALAADIEAVSRIDQVTVYPDGAAVSRLVRIELPAGASTLFLRALPAAVDPNSIRVEGQSDGALAIAAVDVKLVPGDARPVIDPALEERIEKLRREAQLLGGVIESAEAQKSAIQRYANASPEKLGADSKPLDIEKWPLAWEAIGSGLAKMNERLVALKADALRLGQEIAALERARPPAPRPGAPKRDVMIAVEAGAALKGVLTVTYRVSGAGWQPMYDARLVTTGDKPKLELVRRASVTQRTGEDWENVALSLSTVRLARGTAAPDLPTLALKFWEPPVFADAIRPRTMAAPSAQAARQESAASGLAKTQPEAAAPPPAPAQQVVAAVEASAYQVSFNVPGRAIIPQDGTSKSFTLSSRAIEPALSVKTVPALDTTAYLEASFTNEEEAPLLPGPVSIHRDGSFAGRGALALTASGDKVALGFGADDQVKVTRVPLRKRESDSGIFGSSRADVQDFKTTVKNLHGFPLRISVIDRLPVSENAAITVEQLNVTTAPTDKTVDDKRGVMGWTWDYKAGESKDIRVAWRVRWPSDRELTNAVSPK